MPLCLPWLPASGWARCEAPRRNLTNGNRVDWEDGGGGGEATPAAPHPCLAVSLRQRQARANNSMLRGKARVARAGVVSTTADERFAHDGRSILLKPSRTVSIMCAQFERILLRLIWCPTPRAYNAERHANDIGELTPQVLNRKLKTNRRKVRRARCKVMDTWADHVSTTLNVLPHPGVDVDGLECHEHCTRSHDRTAREVQRNGQQTPAETVF